MRRYSVWIKGTSKLIEVQAEDVDLDSVGEGVAFWNFTANGTETKDAVTVAAFPFEGVEYICSSVEPSA